MARPAIPIQPAQVAALARLGLSVPAMAAFFGCERTTLYRRFGAELARGRAEAPRKPKATALPPCFGPTCTMYGD